jgi:hypothetical protein
MGVFSNVSKVYALSSLLQQEKAIKVLKKGRVRLVDGTQNCLSGRGKFPQESNDIECRLTVETTCRFIQKKKQLRFSSELNTNGDALSFFD